MKVVYRLVFEILTTADWGEIVQAAAKMEMAGTSPTPTEHVEPMMCRMIELK